MGNKFIVAGGRDFTDEKRLNDVLWRLVLDEDRPLYDVSPEIVSGGARGADSLGTEFALKFDILAIMFWPDWAEHGKAAGPIRNKQMAEYADTLIAFWDGKSRGTKNMIETALKEGLEIHVYMY